MREIGTKIKNLVQVVNCTLKKVKLIKEILYMIKDKVKENILLTQEIYSKVIG